MNTTIWHSRISATRATSLAPIFGEAVGHVCPQNIVLTDTPMRKRNVDATKSTHPGSPAWRPPPR